MQTIISTIRLRQGGDTHSPAYIFTEPRVGSRTARGER